MAYGIGHWALAIIHHPSLVIGELELELGTGDAPCIAGARGAWWADDPRLGQRHELHGGRWHSSTRWPLTNNPKKKTKPRIALEVAERVQFLAAAGLVPRIASAWRVNGRLARAGAHQPRETLADH